MSHTLIVNTTNLNKYRIVSVIVGVHSINCTNYITETHSIQHVLHLLSMKVFARNMMLINYHVLNWLRILITWSSFRYSFLKLIMGEWDPTLQYENYYICSISGLEPSMCQWNDGMCNLKACHFLENSQRVAVVILLI